MLFSALAPASGVNDEGRQLAAVMLRRLLSSDFNSFYSTLGLQQETFKQVSWGKLPDKKSLLRIVSFLGPVKSSSN